MLLNGKYALVKQVISSCQQVWLRLWGLSFPIFNQAFSVVIENEFSNSTLTTLSLTEFRSRTSRECLDRLGVGCLAANGLGGGSLHSSRHRYFSLDISATLTVIEVEDEVREEVSLEPRDKLPELILFN